MTESTPRTFDAKEQRTWRAILSEHRKTRDRQVCDLFLNGIEILGLSENAIPDLCDINRILEERSGFRGAFVTGLEEASSFYRMLAERKFPVGNFVRSHEDLGYTPAPDIVHDLYGHLPFYTDKTYADFSQAFGAEACKYIDRRELMRQFERFFWFTIEFGLVKTVGGLRIFGAGIASSTGECAYALSGKPEIAPFDVETIRHHEFRIDVMQPKLFCLESVDQLYQSLPELARKVGADA